MKLSEDFLNSFVVGSFKAYWPYDGLKDNSIERLVRKIGRRLGIGRLFMRNVMLLDGSRFDDLVLTYLSQLYNLIVPEGCRFVILNNGFEPFNPRACLDMLAGSRQLVITRDPRDIYASGLNYYNLAGADKEIQAFDNDGINKSFLASDDLATFVKRYKLYRKNLYSKSDKRILHIGFEELVHDYNRSVKRILDFLELSSDQHSRPKTFFIPEESRENVGVWKRFSRRDDIKYIASELGCYCGEV
jgi:hypothetical protein